MSDDGPLGGDDPFGAMPFFGDLFRMMSASKSASGAWESARQLAMSVATEGTSEPVGSSRVDLQACKLEYSIVSPK